MSRFILRRFVQALLTIFGIIFITFILFRQIAGDVSASYVNQKLGKEARQAFYEKHKLNRPLILNYHTRLTFVDNSGGKGHFSIRDSGSSRVVEALSLHPTNVKSSEYGNNPVYVSRFIPVFKWNRKLPEEELLDTSKNAEPYLIIELSSGKSHELNISSISRISDITGLIEDKDIGSLKCFKEKRDLFSVFNSQFFWHFFESITFSGKSYTTNETLMKIISERAVFSLSITVPAVVIGWVVAMMISLFVAYYNNTWIDRTGVFLAVLGMCIPYLAYMIIGQVIMFQIAPEYAAGLSSPVSVYIPIAIAVIAGTGRSVRFYRTIILDEINKDYVVTARAKGLPLYVILFKHVLGNIMLPVLTDVISMLPFLIMGSLLLERFFGIPGLGDLMLTSIYSRDVPIITGLTFLTSVLYVMSLLLTDILYAVFDPRVRLQ